MTRDEIDALETIRCRLSHTEAICGKLLEQDDSELAEAMRGVRYLIEDAVMKLEKMIDPIVGTSREASSG